MRLDKFLSHNGFGTRKEVRQLIKNKEVYVNDQVVSDHGKILDLNIDQVRVQHERIDYKKNVYYMLNKIKGSISSTESEKYPSVLEYIHDFRPDLIIVGRLDVDTEGLLLITNDGQFAHRIAHGKQDTFKTYYVELKDPFDSKFIPKLEKGLALSEAQLKPATLELIDNKRLYLSISEGKYHQVKRMMHACDNEVVYLKRVKIGNLSLDETLAPGDYRELSSEEIQSLLE